jgi:hypothetical protein
VRLVELKPYWAINLEIAGEDPEPEIQKGIEAWARVLGVTSHAPGTPVHHRLRQLSSVFGPLAEEFHERNKARIKSRWRRGLMDEALDRDPVLVPVCPSVVDITAEELGWKKPADRRLHADDIDVVAASIVLESGTADVVTEEEWASLREVFAFGEAIMKLFTTPDPALDLGDLGFNL